MTDCGLRQRYRLPSPSTPKWSSIIRWAPRLRLSGNGSSKRTIISFRRLSLPIPPPSNKLLFRLLLRVPLEPLYCRIFSWRRNLSHRLVFGLLRTAFGALSSTYQQKPPHYVCALAHFVHAPRYKYKLHHYGGAIYPRAPSNAVQG